MNEIVKRDVTFVRFDYRSGKSGATVRALSIFWLPVLDAHGRLVGAVKASNALGVCNTGNPASRQARKPPVSERTLR
jgi:CBS-domain-containing membrane protein